MRQQTLPSDADVRALLERWVVSGVITFDQALRMRADLRDAGTADAPAQDGSHRRSPLVIEALGYLGSVLVVVASVLLASEYWNGLSTVVHLGLVGGVSIILLLCGFAVPARIGPAATRLHAVLWLGATLAISGFLVLLGDEVLTWHGQDLALLVFAGTAVCAAALWWEFRTPVQQAAVFVSMAGTAAAAAARLGGLDELPGLAIWATGAAWFILGWVGSVKPRWAALVLGAIGLMVGGGMTVPANAGIVLSLATVAALVTIALLTRDLLVLGLGAWGALQFLPVAVNAWFPSELAAAAALLLTGVLLVLIAIWIDRRRS